MNLTTAASVLPQSELAAAPASGRWLPLAILGVTLLLVVPLRVRFLDLPMDRDEGEFAYGGQLILEGDLPYRSLYAMKMPGIYVCYAAIEAAFGQTRVGVHLGLLVVNLLTILGLVVLGRRLFDDLTGAMAGAAYALLSLSPSLDALATQSEHFVTLVVVWGFVSIAAGFGGGGLVWFFVAGALFGAAPVIKQHGAPFALAAAAWIVIEQIVGRPFAWRRWLAAAAVFAAGLAVPGAAVFATMWALGVYDQFYFWTIQYARAYVGILTPEDRRENFVVNFDYQLNRFFGITLLWALAGAGLTAVAWYRPARRQAGLLIPWLLVSAAALSLGFYFRTHYFVLVLPILAVLAALAVRALGINVLSAGRAALVVRVFVAAALTLGLLGILSVLTGTTLAEYRNEYYADYKHYFWALFIPVAGGLAWLLHAITMQTPTTERNLAARTTLLFGLLCALPLAELALFYVPADLAQLSRKTYYRNPFVESIAIARKLAENTSPVDRIGLVCSEPQILFYAHRRSASGHIYMYPLVEDHPYARMMQQQLIDEFERAPPKFVVYSNQYVTWINLPSGKDDLLFPWWNKFKQRYEVFGTVDMTSEDDNIRWRDDVPLLSANPTREGLVIYRLKSSGEPESK